MTEKQVNDLWTQICELQVVYDHWELLTDQTRRDILGERLQALEDIHSELHTDE